MIPEEDSYVVTIPITFDVNSKPQGLTNDKFILSGVVFLLWIALFIISFFVEAEIGSKILFDIGSFVVMMVIVRFLLLRESYFKSRRNELVEKDYQYPYSQFWNIYEVDNAYPHICRFANGLKAVFVRFDKDVVVGREENNEYMHYEAISEAYLQMHKRGIECVHIDYMDTVGKDDRVNCLFKMAEDTENQDLSEVLTRLFDNVSVIMEHSYASYDVYCFYYNGKEDLFLDELDVVLAEFMQANYINKVFLDKEEINELVKSVFNLRTFSVNYACDKLFSDLGGTHYLTPIWVERNDERKILNKTREEKAAEQEVRTEEKNLKKSRRRKTSYEKKLEKMRARQEVDIWGDNSEENKENYSSNNNQNNENFDDYSQEEYETNDGLEIRGSEELNDTTAFFSTQEIQNELKNQKPYDDDEEIDIF